MEIDAQMVVLVLLAGVAGYFVFRITKYGGIKQAMFGAPIDSTVGTVSGRSETIKTPITVHLLGGADAKKAIGLEVVAKSVGSYQMLPISLSVAEAKNLVEMLEMALDRVPPTRFRVPCEDGKP